MQTTMLKYMCRNCGWSFQIKLSDVDERFWSNTVDNYTAGLKMYPLYHPHFDCGNEETKQAYGIADLIGVEEYV